MKLVFLAEVTWDHLANSIKWLKGSRVLINFGWSNSFTCLFSLLICDSAEKNSASRVISSHSLIHTELKYACCDRWCCICTGQNQQWLLVSVAESVSITLCVGLCVLVYVFMSFVLLFSCKCLMVLTFSVSASLHIAPHLPTYLPASIFNGHFQLNLP